MTYSVASERVCYNATEIALLTRRFSAETALGGGVISPPAFSGIRVEQEVVTQKLLDILYY